MIDPWHVEQAIKLVDTGYMELGFDEESGIKTQSFKLDGVEETLDQAEKDSKWGVWLCLSFEVKRRQWCSNMCLC